MTQVVTLTLEHINCILEEDNPSTPYLWTALVWIDETTLGVHVLMPPESDDRVALASNLQPGQSAQIPPAVGVATQSFDDLGKAAFIQVTALWQKHSTPGSAVEAGFTAFGTSLQSAIENNLAGLASPDPQTQQQAINMVQKAVTQAVYNAIDNKLSATEKAEIGLGILTLDSEIATGNQVVTNMQSQSFTISLGDPSDGRLLFYLYGNEDGTGNVAGPSVIGDSGWNAFKFLFSPGEGIIYAVDQEGDLLFYRDHNQDGTGNVANPSIIGHGGWGDFKFLFSGGNGIIYAVNQGGDLLFYRDHNQDGTGNVADPSTIGHGGWTRYKFLFSGGNGIIYAVNQQGQLLFYRDHNQDGTGNVANPTVIGDGGWGDFKFLFSAGNGIIYAVNQQGQLLFYRDHNQDGTGNVANPTVIGASGFEAYKFLFSGGGKGIIYAAEVGPTHYYEIPGNFQITTS